MIIKASVNGNTLGTCETWKEAVVMFRDATGCRANKVETYFRNDGNNRRRKYKVVYYFENAICIAQVVRWDNP